MPHRVKEGLGQGQPDRPPVSSAHQSKASGHDKSAENQQGKPSFPRKKKRTVHYGDPDYFDHLPPHLEHLRDLKDVGLPFAHGSFGLWSLSYEKAEDEFVVDSDTLDNS